jgi:small subunit ribosomal protein S17
MSAVSKPSLYTCPSSYHYNSLISMAASLRCLSTQLQRCLTPRTSNFRATTTSFKRPSVLSTSPPARFFSSDNGDSGDSDKKVQEESVAAETGDQYNVQEILGSFRDTSYYDPVERPDYSHMTNQALEDPSAIPGWGLIHSPPKDRSVPRGALVGTVVSTKMQKTVNVAVDRYKIHPKYRKRLRYTRKFMAHDEKEVANTGDLVMITPSHRISKHKHFMLREIIRPKGQL